MTNWDDPMSEREARVRRRRGSGDLVMARPPTIGAGLNELDNLLSQLDANQAEQTPQQQVRGALGAGITAVLTAALAVFIGLVGMRPTTCEDTCSWARDGLCDDTVHPESINLVCSVGSDCADCGPRDTFWLPHWAAVVASLLLTALVVLGVRAAVEMFQLWEAQMRGPGSWARIPLTDAYVGISFINKLANSTQVREKGLKVVQYVLRGVAYSALLSPALSKDLKSLSKATSIARRFFKFGRWVKHFEDLEEAHEQKDLIMRGLLYFRIAANFGADWAEDVCSLERVGILHSLKLGTLSHEFLLFAEYCQFALALVEILVTGVRARKERQVVTMAEAAGAEPNKMLKQRRKLALVRLELVKYVSDVGKALYDCELPFAHEGVFIGCALFSGVMSTHKNICKIYK